MLALAAATSAESSGRANDDVHFFSVVEHRLVDATRAASIKAQTKTKAKQEEKIRRRRAKVEAIGIPSEIASTRSHLSMVCGSPSTRLIKCCVPTASHAGLLARFAKGQRVCFKVLVRPYESNSDVFY